MYANHRLLGERRCNERRREDFDRHIEAETIVLSAEGASGMKAWQRPGSRLHRDASVTEFRPKASGHPGACRNPGEDRPHFSRPREKCAHSADVGRR